MGKLFLPVTGQKHDKRSLEIASLIALERNCTIHLFHVVAGEEEMVNGQRLLRGIEAQIGNYGVDCVKEVVRGDVAGKIIEKLKGGDFYAAVLPIRSSSHRANGVLSERMESIVKGVRECPLIIVQEVDVIA